LASRRVCRVVKLLYIRSVSITASFNLGFAVEGIASTALQEPVAREVAIAQPVTDAAISTNLSGA
jgi:hypothetical protein